MKNVTKQNILLLSIVLGLLIIDLTSKAIMLKIFNSQPYPISNSISVLGEFFKLTYVQNFGITFGMFSSLNHPYSVILLSSTSLLALCVLIYFYKNINNIIQEKALLVAKCSLASILGGAFGNIIDRFMNGFVVDFLDFGIGQYRWYTFNFADICIVSGCIVLSIIMLVFDKQKEQSQ
ncbi:MAG: signal peptidase II [Brevinemataceae bacterium]